MYRGKFRKSPSGAKKSVSLALALTLLLAVAVGVTLAYLKAVTPPVNNEFIPKTVTCEVDEPGWAAGETVKSNVSIRNTSEIPVYIRATWLATWRDGDGNVLAVVPIGKEISAANGDAGNADYTILLGEQTDWEMVGEYYYYKLPVPAKDETSNKDQTSVLIQEIKQVKNMGDYKLHVEIIAEAVQAEPLSAVKAAWPDSPMASNTQ